MQDDAVDDALDVEDEFLSPVLAGSPSKVKILPYRSATTQAFLPGTGVSSSGSVNFWFG